MNYLLYDIETTIKEGWKRKPNPFYGINKVIVSSSRINSNPSRIIYDPKGIASNQVLPFEELDTVELIVGHNVKFDLLFIWGEPKLQDWFRKGGRIWDTMLAEYLLTAQLSTYPSLNKVSAKYGGTQKDERLKEYWNAGIDTDEIPPETLLPYAEEDINNTELVYLAQVREAQKTGMTGLIEGYMDHLLATAEMEYNGVYVDRQVAQDLLKPYQKKLEELELKLDLCTNYMFRDLQLKFDPAKKSHVSGVLFNTWVENTVKEPILNIHGKQVVYGPKAQKAGQPKFANKILGEYLSGFNLNRKLSRKSEVGHTYSADEEILEALKKDTDNVEARKFIELMLEYRGTQKFVSTYLYSKKVTKKGKETETGFIPCIYPADSCIHHQLDSVQTATGRLNGRAPNMQNVPKEIRQMFTSRFGKEGVIVEFDYSQLEIWVQAYITGSQKLVEDLQSGVDFHLKRLSYAEELPYEVVVDNFKNNPEVWTEKRRKAKGISYQKAYGAHTASIAEKTELPEEIVQKVFDKEREDYPEVDQFTKEVEETVFRTRTIHPSREPIPIKDKDLSVRYGKKVYAQSRPWELQHVGFYQSITGKRYHFEDYATTSEKLRAGGKDPYRYFLGPQLANYPIQGTAADIVALSVGRVWRTMLQEWQDKKAYIINEVHDSLVLDVENYETAINHVQYYIKEILEDIKSTFKKYLDINFDVPLKVDVKIGKSWRGDEDE